MAPLMLRWGTTKQTRQAKKKLVSRDGEAFAARSAGLRPAVEEDVRPHIVKP